MKIWRLITAVLWLASATALPLCAIANMGDDEPVPTLSADAAAGKDLLWTSDLLGKPFLPEVTQKADPAKGIRRQTKIDLFGINIAWGILSTPVVDLDANQMYVVNWVASADGKSRALFLHRIRLDDGTEIPTAQPIHVLLRFFGARFYCF